MTPKTVNKTVYVYESLLVRPDGTRDRSAVPWAAIHSELESLDIEDREHDGVIFSALGKIAGHHAFAMHKPISSDFLTKIDKQLNSVSDLSAEDLGDQILTHSTAFIPLDDCGRFSLCRGDNSSPTHVDLEAFLRKSMSFQQGERLDIQNVMSRPRIREFEQASEVKAFSGRYSTQRDLTNYHLQDDGIVTYSHQLSDAISGDLVIEISVHLEPHSNHRPQRQKFKDLVARGMKIMGKQDSRARVTVQRDGLEEELRLVAHHMGVKIELPEDVSQTRMFTNLVHGLIGALPHVKEELANSYEEQ